MKSIERNSQTSSRYRNRPVCIRLTATGLVTAAFRILGFGQRLRHFSWRFSLFQERLEGSYGQISNARYTQQRGDLQYLSIFRSPKDLRAWDCCQTLHDPRVASLPDRGTFFMPSNV